MSLASHAKPANALACPFRCSVTKSPGTPGTRFVRCSRCVTTPPRAAAHQAVDGLAIRCALAASLLAWSVTGTGISRELQSGQAAQRPSAGQTYPGPCQGDNFRQQVLWVVSLLRGTQHWQNWCATFKTANRKKVAIRCEKIQYSCKNLDLFIIICQGM